VTKPDDPPYAEFGKQLRAHRLRAGISTQRDMADRLTDAGEPYDYTVISHWESGRRCPSLETLITLVQVLVEAKGIQTVEEANHLLWLAGKRSLSEDEVARIFGEQVGKLASASVVTPVSDLLASPTLLGSQEHALPRSARHWVKTGLFIAVGLSMALAVVFWGVLPALARQANQAGLSALTKGDSGQAMRQFRWAVRLSPGNAAYRYNLGYACENLADVECAMSEYRAAIERRSDLFIVYNNLGRLLIQQGRPDEAHALLWAALQHPTRDGLEVALRKNMGWVLLKQDWPEDALEQLVQARDLQETLQPLDAEAYVRLAEIYRLMALSYEALEQPVEAQRAWRNCLGWATVLDTAEGEKWEIEARAHLQELE